VCRAAVSEERRRAGVIKPTETRPPMLRFSAVQCSGDGHCPAKGTRAWSFIEKEAFSPRLPPRFLSPATSPALSMSCLLFLCLKCKELWIAVHFDSDRGCDFISHCIQRPESGPYTMVNPIAVSKHLIILTRDGKKASLAAVRWCSQCLNARRLRPGIEELKFGQTQA
jgi:hypothetical protein